MTSLIATPKYISNVIKIASRSTRYAHRSSDIAAFESTTTDLLAAKKKEVKEEYEQIEKKEMNDLYKNTQEKDKIETKKINDKFDAIETTLKARIAALDEFAPGPPPPQPNVFCPTQIYYPANAESVISPEDHQEKIKSFLFRDFISTTISDDSFNYLADNILGYVPLADIKALAVASKTLSEMASFHGGKS